MERPGSKFLLSIFLFVAILLCIFWGVVEHKYAMVVSELEEIEGALPPTPWDERLQYLPEPVGEGGAGVRDSSSALNGQLDEMLAKYKEEDAGCEELFEKEELWLPELLEKIDAWRSSSDPLPLQRRSVYEEGLCNELLLIAARKAAEENRRNIVSTCLELIFASAVKLEGQPWPGSRMALHSTIGKVFTAFQSLDASFYTDEKTRLPFQKYLLALNSSQETFAKTIATERVSSFKHFSGQDKQQMRPQMFGMLPGAMVRFLYPVLRPLRCYDLNQSTLPFLKAAQCAATCGTAWKNCLETLDDTSFPLPYHGFAESMAKMMLRDEATFRIQIVMLSCALFMPIHLGTTDTQCASELIAPYLENQKMEDAERDMILCMLETMTCVVNDEGLQLVAYNPIDNREIIFQLCGGAVPASTPSRVTS